MLATPLRVIDVCLGHLLWMAVRILGVSAVFGAVMAMFGADRSWRLVPAVLAGTLTGVAFAAPIAAFAARQESDQGFNFIFRFGIIPLFLFSGTFFPISQLPVGLQPIAWLTPLWHGVSLTRSLAIGHVSVAAVVGHTAYLAAFTAVGTLLAARSYRSRLET
jgi:lipooligosaccharide transport system permease protein